MATSTTMPRTAFTYLWIVLSCGAIATGFAVSQWTPLDGAATATCLALAVWASLFKVRLPGIDLNVSPGFVIVLVATANLGLAATVVVGLVCAFVQTLWRAKSAPSWMRLSFNLSTMVVASVAAHTFSHALVAGTERAGALAVAGMALQVVNTLVVSAMVCLMRHQPLSTVWRSVQFWTLPYYFAGGIVASLWKLQPITLATPLCLTVAAFLLHTAYREYVQSYRSNTAASA